MQLESISNRPSNEVDSIIGTYSIQLMRKEYTLQIAILLLLLLLLLFLFFYAPFKDHF